METKICTKCSEEFPATPEYFSRHPNCAEGLYPRCKVCKYEEKKENIYSDIDDMLNDTLKRDNE